MGIILSAAARSECHSRLGQEMGKRQSFCQWHYSSAIGVYSGLPSATAMITVRLLTVTALRREPVCIFWEAASFSYDPLVRDSPLFSRNDLRRYKWSSHVSAIYTHEDASRDVCFCVILDMILRKWRTKRMDDEDERMHASFDLDRFSRKECRKLLWFRKVDLERRWLALQISDIIETKKDDCATGLEGQCILLRRLSYPKTWLELCRVFARSQGSWSRIFYHVLLHNNTTFERPLQSWTLSWLTEGYLTIFFGCSNS